MTEENARKLGEKPEYAPTCQLELTPDPVVQDRISELTLCFCYP